MRIVFGPSSYAPNLGGIEHLTQALATTCAAQGHEVMVITNRWPDTLAASENIAGTPVERIPMPAPASRPRALLAYLGAAADTRHRIAAMLESFRPDVIQAVGASWQAVHLEAAANRARVPFILNLQGETAMDDARIYERSFLLRRAFRKMASRAAAVVACSTWTLSDARRLAPGTAGEVIPNGVDYEDLAGISPAAPGRRVLAYGRLVANKGFDLLIDAASGSDWELAIGGAGSEAAGLQALARRKQVSVDWLGRLDRAAVVRELGRASVVAVPSRMEPFGIVALEAMAAGRPVVVSKVGGMQDFLAGGVSIDPTDARALRAAVDECLRHPELGTHGRAAAAAYAWPEVAERWLALYARVSSRS